MIRENVPFRRGVPRRRRHRSLEPQAPPPRRQEARCAPRRSAGSPDRCSPLPATSARRRVQNAGVHTSAIVSACSRASVGVLPAGLALGGTPSPPRVRLAASPNRHLPRVLQRGVYGGAVAQRRRAERCVARASSRAHRDWEPAVFARRSRESCLIGVARVVVSAVEVPGIDGSGAHRHQPWSCAAQHDITRSSPHRGVDGPQQVTTAGGREVADYSSSIHELALVPHLSGRAVGSNGLPSMRRA
jgi:hypothetical protein